MLNSIKSFLGPSDVISEITLLINEPSNSNKVFVVLEGDTDRRLFKSLLHESSTILMVHNTKNGLCGIVNEYFVNSKRVIGIRDRDYEMSKSCSKGKVFFCDYCCAEMMIISIDECMQKLASNFYLGELRFDELRLHILSMLSFLSVCRMHNERKMLGIEFGGVKPSSCFNEDSHIMHKNILSRIKIQNKQKTKSLRKLPRMILDKHFNLAKLLEITNGHDFIDLFVKICNNVNQKKIGKDSVENSLRCCLGNFEFVQTKLYKKLSVYQNKNTLSIVKNPINVDD